VARSDIWGLLTLGAEVTICGPGTLLPREFETMGVRRETNLDAAIRDAQVINVLRCQFERMEGSFIPSRREYARLYGINRERLKKCRDDVVVMHPGPINRGVELEPEVADGEHSVILDQVRNGVAVRMAVLYLVRGGAMDEAAEGESASDDPATVTAIPS
jgi:aspartate carbamoyltransferase catalytic subunit